MRRVRFLPAPAQGIPRSGSIGSLAVRLAQQAPREPLIRHVHIGTTMEAQAAVAPRKGKEFLLSELYVSVQGESSLVGLPTVFVRLYTCNLRCRWCDSMHAVEGGDFTRVGVDATVKKILRLAGDLQSDARGIRNLCWTGGEPLLQGESIARAIERLPETFVHSIETDGEIDLSTFDALVPDERKSGRARYVMDVKCPGSGMVANKAYANLERLREHDEVKFVH